MHVRQQIREAIFNLLEPLPELQAFVAQAGFFQANQLPAVNLLTGDETVLKRYMQGGCSVQHIQIDVLIEVYVLECTHYEDALDSHCVNIQEVLVPDTTLNGLVHGFEFDSSIIVRNRDGERTIFAPIRLRIPKADFSPSRTVGFFIARIKRCARQFHPWIMIARPEKNRFVLTDTQHIGFPGLAFIGHLRPSI